MRHLFLTAALATLGPAAPAPAQGLFSPRVYVNDSAISQYEVQQRALFIDAIGGAPDLERAAIDALIEDRLYQSAAKALKLSVTDEQLSRGLAEFATRAQLSPEEFTARMAEEGVSPETLRDFVRAGILWREVVRARFAGQVQISDAELDRVMSAEAQRPGIELALSEIILPMIPQYREQSLQIAALIEAEVRDGATFAEAARRFSAAGSRERGGELDWMPEGNLPALIAGAVRGLRPGQISGRIEVPNAIAFFLLRGERETPRPAAASLIVDYARLSLPGPREAALVRAAAIAGTARGCGDLYLPAREIGGAALARSRQVFGTVPADVGMELAGLDPGETSTGLSRGDAVELVMLCAREPQAEPPPEREAVRARLLDQRLGALARNYLSRLKADAIIRRP